jgi:glycosyltransferase involved in cell wall biosynthesis
VRLSNTCDIGVYTLLDDEWSKRKWGFKAIEFMAPGAPVVAAAVGVIREIIQDGVNGFLASSEDDCVEKVGRLVVDRDLRYRFGEAVRRTVEAHYAMQVRAWALSATRRGIVDRSGRGAERTVR